MGARSTRVPILVLTADATPNTKRRALSLGASEFVNKPVDTTEVLRVRNPVVTRLHQLDLRERNRSLEQRLR